MSMENITTIGSLLREVWRYEPDILKLIFEFLFIRVYEDKEKKHRYILALPKPGTTSIKKDAFSGCSLLKSVTIGNSVTNIGDAAFKGCSSLQLVTIGNSVTNIGVAAFKGCSSLKSVTIPNSVTSIGRLAFSGCSSLQSVTIPDSVTIIDEGAFIDCDELNQVSIPKHLEEKVKELKVFPRYIYVYKLITVRW